MGRPKPPKLPGREARRCDVSSVVSGGWQQWQQLSFFFSAGGMIRTVMMMMMMMMMVANLRSLIQLVVEIWLENSLGLELCWRSFGNIIYSSLPTSPSTRCCRCLCVQVYSWHMIHDSSSWMHRKFWGQEEFQSQTDHQGGNLGKKHWHE